ncbi:MAG: MFS transporter, partial [Candidatus Latescibacterota bacterium]|nr:MFS transporter [Candidatus Latescibacterota bacterium]
IAGMMIQSLLYNLYLTRLGFQEDFIGQHAGLAPISSGILAFPTGFLSDRFGRRPFLLGTAGVMATTQICLVTLSDPLALLIMSFLAGTSGAFLWVNHVPFLSENARPERRAQAIAIWMSIQAITRMVVSLIGGHLPGIMAGLTGTRTELPEPYRYALYLGAGLCVISAIPLLGIESGVRKQNTPDTIPEDAPFPARVFTAFSATSICRGASMGFSFPFFNVFLQESLDVSTGLIGVIFFVAQIVTVPATVAAPEMARRWGAVRTIVPCRMIGSISIVCLGLSGHIWAALIFILIGATAESITTPTEMTFATQVMPRKYWGRLQSVRVTGFQIPSGIASVCAGFLIVKYGYWLTFALAGILRLASAVIFFAVFYRMNIIKPENEPSVLT